MTDLDMDLCRASARDQLAAMRRGTLSAVELLRETRSRYDEVNPRINAVVTTDFAAAELAAANSDRRRAAGQAPRPLEGLPVAVKDLEETAGMRTTFGSALHADFVPSQDSLVVERLRAAGAVIYGKTNTPEFGTGSHTFNRVFGTTTNPYAPAHSAGGSSGGAAAALAAGLASVADGSDMGGSLRNPASFCNVVGLRPSAGRVPNWPTRDAWDTLATNGPMARTVGDAALLLSVLSPGTERTPISFPAPTSAEIAPLDAPLRVGWSRTLDGLDIAPAVTQVLEDAGLPTLQVLGHHVTDTEPELAAADRVFRVMRGIGFAHNYAHLLDSHREELGAELIANTEAGMQLGLDDYLEARDQRTRIYGRMAALFERIDVLAAPVVTVLPFPAEQRWPSEINGVPQQDYLEWMRASWRITVTGFTAISVPCGFSPEGLPVGIQLIAPPRHEARLLALAAQFERARPAWRETPRILTSPTPTLSPLEETEALR
ncbi:Aspartyl-tRNA(Asn) amidotransferase subunit A amidotransferase subunit A [Leucobacter sp. 7(1)]|uniref:amidase n=1 Tax=Leucobacter sp. 7(1) TaxID=1255613 RepID=UPI00097E912A|nr:amidase family protein [Leucobacter sp. 7(1)]SJN09019.1 Aspartyl-tRNA(Asn) amidotransferase subunit A amidotransferase subunit A [Leucobacter sp. 7(1)]